MLPLESAGAAQRSRAIAGALCWIGGLEFFVAEAIAAAGWPDYSYATFDISDLGAVSCAPLAEPLASGILQLCSPRHAVMNVGFMLVGLLHLAGLALTWTLWPRGWSMRIALFALAAGAAGAVLVGLAPVDVAHGRHIVGAAFGLIVANVGLLLLGLTFVRRGPAVGIFTLAFGAMGLAAFVVYRSELDFGIGHGAMERVAAYPQTIWYAVMGVLLLKQFWSERRA